MKQQFKKKVFVCINDMQIGGIQSAFKMFLDTIPDDIEVDLLVFSGDYASIVKKKNINCIKTKNRLKIIALSQDQTKKMGFIWWLIRGFFAFLTNLFSDFFSYKLLFSFIFIREKYDLAISYSQNASNKILYGGVPQFVLWKTKAKKKIVFIHDDFKRPEMTNKKNLKIYRKFDTIVALSEGCKVNISKLLPNKNIVVIRNYINAKTALVQFSQGVFQTNKDKIKFLTVCRLSDEKGLLRTIKCFSNLDKTLFEWHIVGDGPLKDKILSAIKLYGLDNNVFLLGKKENPLNIYHLYDCYLMCSYHEALPVVIDEAHVIGLPVIATDYSSASSQLFKNDFCCPNNDNELEKLLSKIIERQIQLVKTDNTSTIDDINQNVEQQIKNLFDD